MKEINAWTGYSEKDLEAVEQISSGYMNFLDNGKTERECTDAIVEMAEKNGYRNLDDIVATGEKLEKGSKVYAVNMHKAVVLFNMGEDILRDGLNILGAHIDSPRLDLKQNPLYESDEYAFLNTQYYGGIKKYQWVTMPLAIHGVVAKKDGTTVKIRIGEEPGDPVFFVTDLLVHLAQDQMEKKASSVVEGEALDIIAGTIPMDGDSKDSVKANVLKLLK